MDLSKQTNESFASASVYFDADSTVSSSSAFKTLEALSDISNISAAGTNNSTLEAKSSNKKVATPLYAKSKNTILQEFHAQCSTPTHAQLLRTVDVKRGSDAALCIDLGMAFTTMEEDDKMPILEENKENALSGEGSTLSSSTSMDVVTVIDRNKTTLSKANEEEIENTEKIPIETNKKVQLTENRNAPLKPRRSLLPARITRKSVCEPDLKTNRPSRISMATTTRIPPPKSMASQLKPPTTQLVEPTGKTAQAEKRAFPYASRMSVVVKTTLNSPARKLMRRSVMTSSVMQTRRSVMPAQSMDKPVTEKRRSMLPARLKPMNSAPQLTAVKVQQRQPIATPAHEFVCSVCQAKFRIKSLFDAHKRAHEDGVPGFVRKTNSQGSSNSMSSNGTPQCKYCDKKFALVRTLHIHLLQNCTKIPPTEKRKLEYTEMAHVEKAQLPTFSHSQNSSQASAASSVGISKSNSTLSANEFRAKSKESAIIAKDLVNALSVLEISPPVLEDKAKQMAPPASSKVKKKTAHMGVYRTPTKLVTCHICKQHFRDVLEYTHHTMTKHQSDSGNHSFTK